MRLLIDTHAYLWASDLKMVGKLSARAQKAYADPANDIFLSVASIWEMAIKVNIRKLELPAPIEEVVRRNHRVQLLPITPIHACAVAEVPRHHSDPFDRMLIAIAQCEGMWILTCDQAFSAYDVETVW